MNCLRVTVYYSATTVSSFPRPSNGLPCSLHMRATKILSAPSNGLTARFGGPTWLLKPKHSAGNVFRAKQLSQRHRYVRESVPTPPSTKPWQRVFVDLYGPMPNGQHLLAPIDQLTRYPVINVFSTTPTTAGVVKALRSTLSRFDLPEELVSDNSPQFRSSAFADFLAQHAIQHRHTPPLWPQANGAVECLNRTIGKVLRTAKLAGEDINVALDQWLLAYRTTPHPATHEAPATLMFGRPIRDSLPCITAAAPDLPSAAHRDQQFRQSQCDAANATRRSNTPILTPGQRVLRRNEQAHKLSPQWDPNPWTVDQISGSTVTISNSATGQRSTRHNYVVRQARNCCHTASPSPTTS